MNWFENEDFKEPGSIARCRNCGKRVLDVSLIGAHYIGCECLQSAFEYIEHTEEFNTNNLRVECNELMKIRNNSGGIDVVYISGSKKGKVVRSLEVIK